MNLKQHIGSHLRALFVGILLLLLIGCSQQSTTLPTTTIDPEILASGLSAEEFATLNSLEKVDDFPLYTMHYVGEYTRTASQVTTVAAFALPTLTFPWPDWGCSLFTTLWVEDSLLYGRNFDWRYSPGLLLFTHPHDGYDSVSMVDIDYLVETDQVYRLAGLPLGDRKALLEAPFWPFDGMNEHGLVVGMAAVPGSKMPYDPDKQTLDSLMIMREILDHAQDVAQAIAILERYNIRWDGGPALHYLVADRTGRAVLVEFYEGEMVLIPNEGPWHQATNHLRSIAQKDSSGCWRYDKIHSRIADLNAHLSSRQALDLLSDVSWGDSENGTQWSIVYDMLAGKVDVVMGRQYQTVHTIPFPLLDE